MLSCTTDTLLFRSTEMPSGRLPQRQRQRRHRVNRRSAAPAIQTHPRTKIPLLTTPHRHHNVPVVPSVPISADRPSFVGHSDRVAGAGGSRPLVSTDFPFLQSTVAPEEGDSFMPAAAVSAAANRAGGMDDGKSHRLYVGHFNGALTTPPFKSLMSSGLQISGSICPI